MAYAVTNPACLVHQMSEDMQKLQMFFGENLLSLNLEKTKYMIFRLRGRQVANQTELKVGTTTIEKVDSFKYLGLTFDTALSWHAHVDILRNSISSYCGLFWRISNLLPRNSLLLCTKHLYNLNCSIWSLFGELRRKLY